jgi:hypothetical protein
VVFVNDDPAEGSIRSYLSELCRVNSNFVYIEHDRNRGIFQSYLTGFSRVSGLYCTIFDADDIIHLAPVLRALRERADYELIFTNEYKISASGLSVNEYFRKPDFDFLSSCFYFYMHHLTLFKSDIVRRIVVESDHTGLYGTFDFWLTLHYFRRIDKSRARVLKLDDFAYGWRIHSGSTASDVNVKPSNSIERLKLVRSYFQDHDDPGVFRQNRQYAYSVNGDFFSAIDMFGLPPRPERADDVWNWLAAVGNPERTETVLRWTGYFDPQVVCYSFALLRHIPLRYLLKLVNEPIFVISPLSAHLFEGDNSFKYHIHHVPFIKRLAGSELLRRQVFGFLIGSPAKGVHSSFEDQLSVVLVKELGN